MKKDKDLTESLALWEKFGKYVLMAMPYADNIIVEGRDCIIRDIDGNEFLDLAAGQFCAILGHNHPKLIERITEQTKKLLHTGTQFLSPAVLEASAKFAEVAPGNLQKSIFFSTGTEANEFALTMAKVYTRKTGIVGLSRGYYGLSLATKSLSSIFRRKEKYDSNPLVPETFRLLSPYCFRCPVGSKYPDCNFLCMDMPEEAVLKENQDNIAAFIIEPILSAGGMIVPPPGYLKQLKALAEKYDALLIADEAQTGFGRTGKWFAVEHHDVVPDILVVSKSAGGGFPVSGIITTEKVARRLENQGFHHLASHQSDPVAAAAVTALIDVIKEEGLVQRAEAKGRYFMDRLRELQRKYPAIGDVRGQGLMIGVEIVKDPDAPTTDHLVAPVLTAACKKRGVHLTYTYFEPVLRFLPPLTITKEQIDATISVLDDALRETVKGHYSKADLVPQNPYSKAFVEKSTGRKTIRHVFSRLYETSPHFWVKKISSKMKH